MVNVLGIGMLCFEDVEELELVVVSRARSSRRRFV